ncbi:MAG: hypothetical protein ACI35O_09065 [Bacillaceae bacterium]
MGKESLAIQKIEGAIESLNRSKDNYIQGNKLAAKGDLDYVVDKARMSIAIILAEIEEENDGKIYK